MYQALLALGDRQSAKKMLKQIPRDDPHVCFVIKASQAAYQTKDCKNKAFPAVHEAGKKEGREEKEEKENSENKTTTTKKKKKKKKKVSVNKENNEV